MRPRHLEVTAIGPFGGTVEVDFDRLSALGVFHIHGNTGSGKTSLLDAISFALYGKGTGTRLSDGIRSQHAEPHVEAMAALEFSASGQDWRIVRKPPQTRAKKRGDGLVKNPHQSVQLLKRSGDRWEPHLSAVGEIDKKVHELVGLDHLQFNQVVVLPQGGFQRVLQAGTKERRALLQTLFGTLRFELYGDRLAERARGLQQAHADFRHTADAASARLRGKVLESGLLGEEELSADYEDHVHVVARTAVTNAQHAMEESLRRQGEARHRLDQGRTDAERHQRRVGALSSLKALAEEEAEIEAIEVELQNAQRVAPALPALQRLSQSEQATERASERVAKRRAMLDVALDAASAEHRSLLDLSHTEPPADEQRLSRALDNALRDAADEIDKAEAQCQALAKTQQLQKQASRFQQEAVELSKHLEAASEKRAVALRRLEIERSTASRLALLTDRRKALQTQVNAMEKLAAARTLAQEAAQHLQAMEAAERSARQEQSRLFEARIRNMAGELAAGLATGDACPVCGGCEHPHPAAQTEATSPEMFAALEQQIALSAAAVLEARFTHDQRRTEVSKLEALAGDGDGTDLQLALNAVIEEEHEARSADIRVGEIESALAALVAEMEPLAVNLEDAKNRSTEALAEYKAAQSGLDPAFSSEAEVQQRLTAAQRNRDDLQKLCDLGRSWARANAECSVCATAEAADRDHLNSIIREHQISGIESVREHARNTKNIDELRSVVTSWQQRKASAEQVLADPDVARATSAPDLAALESALREADEALAQAGVVHTEARAVARDVNALLDEVRSARLALGPAHDEWERVQQLADMCRGVYVPNKMSLESYVLAAHLEQVADAASQRLSMMTEGRFTLRHSDQRSGAGSSGLALLVRDAHTGLEREVSTLSGGETFLASMALALGLSDVVQQHAGGVSIDVLFIDEGFGTLDADSLELAMAHLDQVRAGGRVIGLISHVASLRERVPAGLEVVRGRNGSEVNSFGDGESLSA